MQGWWEGHWSMLSPRQGENPSLRRDEKGIGTSSVTLSGAIDAVTSMVRRCHVDILIWSTSRQLLIYENL